MKTHLTTAMRPLARGLGLAGAAILLATTSQAGLQIPYVVNPDTMHLWHLDDASTQNFAVDAVTTSVNGAVGITLTNLGMPYTTPATFPYNNTTLGAAAYPGLGSAYSGTTKQHVLYGGAFPNVSQFCNPTTGAFTFEALISVNTAFASADIEILSGDNGLGIANRGWQWRISGGSLEWDLLAGSTDNDFKAALPTAGPDAIALNQWFHVAVTFTGQSPTNGDAASVMTFYWTLLDPSRTAADRLAQYTTYGAGLPLRPLNGATEGVSQPSLGIGGSARQITTNPGNNEGAIGSLDEVRVSDVCLQSNQMAFVTGGAFPPKFTANPPATTLTPYGGTLVLNTSVSASQPATNTWLLNGVAVPNQSATSLNVTNVTFADGGPYVLVVRNQYGSATSTVAQVTVGAAPTGLYSTGVDTNGVVSAGDVPDPHYFLVQSQNPNFLGPTAMIFEYNYPIEFAPGNGNWGPGNGLGRWIGDQGNLAGSLPGSPAGQYIFRTPILFDQADPSAVFMSANFFINGGLANIIINGRSTGIAFTPAGPLYLNAFTLTTSGNALSATVSGPTITTTTFNVTNAAGWFVPGINTIDFVENLTSSQAAIMLEAPYAVAQALPPGLPVITNQPVSAVVRDSSVSAGTEATFSVVALGRPPLSYQWWADGAPIAGATSRTLQFVNPTAGAQGTDFSVVVANSSGSVTSQVAVLTLVSSNQLPNAATFNYVGFAGQNITLPFSAIIQTSVDPDGDAITYLYSDTMSTNAVQYGSNNVNQVGAALVYSPVEGYLGDDQFSYTIADVLGASSVGYVNVLMLPAPTPSSQTVPPGLSASFSVGMPTPPVGYAFQWRLNGVNIPGATAGQLNITNAQLANSGSYTLAVIDPHGVAWPSPAVTLTVEAYAPHALPIVDLVDSSEQPAYPASNAMDGLLTDFWVSYGTSAAGVPTVASPEWLFVTFPRQVALAEFLIYPRSGYGPANMQVIVNSQLAPGTPPNGTETLGIPTNGTVIYTGTMANSANPLDVSLLRPVYATNLQLYITSAYSAYNVQVAEMVFNERALPGTFADWELNYFTTSAQINNAAISGIGADPDHDGVPNLLEFAVGGNPLVPDKTNAAMTAISLPAGQIAVQFQERTQLGDVTRSFLASPDLAHWTNAVPVSVTAVQNLGTASLYQAVFPAQPAPLYFRLNYTVPNWQRQ